MFATMAAMCGAMRGACAMIVASTFNGEDAWRSHERAHLAQQLAAVDALVACVAVRKVLADVAEGRGAQERIADRMQEDIRVAMAQEALLVRDLDAADDELAPRDELVDVESLADAHG